jgi:TolA-binding protein
MSLRLAALLGGLLAAAVLAAATAHADDADDQFAVAVGHYAQGRWQLAAEQFQAFLDRYPDHPQVNQGVFYLAEALLQTGRNDEADKHFRLYLSRQPQGQYARPALFRAGETAYLSGKFAPAKAELAEFLAKYPDDKLNAYVLPYLGGVASAEGDAAAAIEYFRNGLSRFPEGPLQDDCRLGLARALEKQNNNEEAERLYLAVAGKTGSPLAAEAQFRLGALHYAAGQYAQAIAAFDAFQTKWAESPWRVHARLGRGWALLKLNRLEEAKSQFRGLIADPQVGIEARYWLGLTEKAQEDWAAAATTLLAAADADPHHALGPAIRFHAGDALLRAGDPVGACRQFDQVIRCGGEAGQWLEHALRGKVQAAWQSKDHEAVDRQAAEFEQRCHGSPLKADVQLIRAASLVQRKNYQPAVELLEPLVVSAGQDPRQPDRRYLLATAYEGLGRYEEALAVLLPVVDSATGRLKADAQLRQASVLLAMQRYAEAVTPLEAFLAGKPAGDAAVDAQGKLAICYARGGQLDKAKTLYGELLEKNPPQELIGPTTAQLVEAAYDARDAEWSAQLSRRLLHGGGSAEFALKGLAGLGWSHFQAGRLAEAEAAFNQLLQQDPPQAMAVEAALARGQILEQLHQGDRALAMYDLVIDKHPSASQHADALLAAARLHDKLQQARESAALYERLDRQYPQFPKHDVVLYEWAWVRQDLGEADQAAALFQRLRKEHPQSRYAADAAYRLARRTLEAKDYSQAKQLVSEILAGNPEEKIRQYTRYLEGQIAVAEQDWEGVGRAFETLLQEFPDSPLRLASQYWVAEAIFRRGDYEAAGQQFEQLARQAQGRREPWLAMIPLRRAQILGQQKKWHEAYAIAEKIEAHYPNFEQQYEVDYLLGRCLHAGAEMQAARDAFQKVIRSPAGAKTETAAMAQWMVGETYFHQKNYEAALREYLRLEILYAYPTWQAAALLQGAKCHELLGRRKEAAELYTRLLKVYPTSSLADEAGQRLRAATKQPAGSSQ